MNNIQKLLEYQKKIATKEYISNILGWDLKVSTPVDAKDYVIDVKASIDLETFNLKTSLEYETLLKECIQSSEFNCLSDVEKRFIKELFRKYELNKKVPNTFYQEYMKLCSKANTIWEVAKKENNYKMYEPYLDKIIKMTKEYYTYMYPNMNVYDAMLNTYEEGMTSDVIDVLFKELKDALIPLVDKVKDKMDNFKEYTKECSSSELMDCANYLLEYIGFDLNRGALGIYPHGFMEKMSSNDIRIAFKHGNKPVDFLSTIIHEGGHGIFEQNIDPKISTLCNTCIDGLYALHESQSRFYENILGRNINFWIPIFDDIKSKLHLDLTLDELDAQLNHVQTGLIRTASDELTYCLHIIIRYEIERDIFNNNISAKELPELWNRKMKEYLGLDVPSDSVGVLQDVHWSEGSFGYFPSYLLGNIYDGMFMECIEENVGNIDEILRSGNIKQITNYLIDNIYRYGGTYISKEVIEKLCHKEISSKPIIDYFYQKYDE